MKNIWLYTPEICDGDFCPKDCDACPKKELIFEREEGDSMSDYIKREDAIKALEGWKISGEMILATVPSVDVVEVVRCKDCKWRDTEPKYNMFLSNGCRWHEAESPNDDDFCSYGERADT